MGQKWDDIPIFHTPIFPIFPEVEDLPHRSLCKLQLTALIDGKIGHFATHQHSIPQRPVQMTNRKDRQQWDVQPTASVCTVSTGANGVLSDFGLGLRRALVPRPLPVIRPRDRNGVPFGKKVFYIRVPLYGGASARRAHAALATHMLTSAHRHWQTDSDWQRTTNAGLSRARTFPLCLRHSPKHSRLLSWRSMNRSCGCMWGLRGKKHSDGRVLPTAVKAGTNANRHMQTQIHRHTHSPFHIKVPTVRHMASRPPPPQPHYIGAKRAQRGHERSRLPNFRSFEQQHTDLHCPWHDPASRPGHSTQTRPSQDAQRHTQICYTAQRLVAFGNCLPGICKAQRTGSLEEHARARPVCAETGQDMQRAAMER